MCVAFTSVCQWYSDSNCGHITELTMNLNNTIQHNQQIHKLTIPPFNKGESHPDMHLQARKLWYTSTTLNNPTYKKGLYNCVLHVCISYVCVVYTAYLPAWLPSDLQTHRQTDRHTDTYETHNPTCTRPYIVTCTSIGHDRIWKPSRKIAGQGQSALECHWSWDGLAR